MGANKLLVLENNLGQKVRTLSVDTEILHIVYMLDSRRIEAVADLTALNESEVEYQLLQQIRMSDMTEKGLSLNGLGHVRLHGVDTAAHSPVYELGKEEDDKNLNLMLKRSAVSHIAIVGLLLIAGIIAARFATKEVEPTLVTIVVPKEEVKKVETPKERPHVKMSQTKIKPTKKLFKPVVKHKLVTKPYKVVTAKAVDIQRVGALAALGGLAKGSKSNEGLDMNSLKNIRSAGTGSGGGGVGGAGRGGMKGYLPGSGLIGGSAGSGAQAQSAGGYGTRGTGGGKAGYGKISLVGGTSAMSLPLDDEASVAGGLDPDQIIAVINRNKGEISYCYEKGLQAQPNTGSGRVAVDFVIGPNGRITRARIAQTSLDSKQVENCIVARMKTWQFPHPVGKVNVDVLYPFKLTRVSSR